MFSKYSVKKPLTVFMGVIMVIILGAVSYSRMKPDLLPNINLPYAMVVTAYPGATPEEVEDTVTKPLEQTMATLDNIESITSTSGENVSTIVLSFAEDVNMDTLTAEIREKINGVSGGWNEMVSTPYIIKMNPDMLPVVVAAMNREGYDNIELTQFLEKELMPKLEGISGVASVSTGGATKETINVYLSKVKIDELNGRIKAELDRSFADAEREFAQKEAELADGLAETETQQNQLDAGQRELDAGKNALIDQASSAESQLIGNKIEIETAKNTLTASLTELDSNIDMLHTLRNTLADIKAGIDRIEGEINGLDKDIAVLQEVAQTHPAYLQQQSDLQQQMQALTQAYLETELSEEALGQTQAQLVEVENLLGENEAALAARNTTYDDLFNRLRELEEARGNAQKTLEALREQLSAAGYFDMLNLGTVIQELDGEIAKLQSARNTLKQAQQDLNTGAATVDAALAELNRQKLGGMLELSGATAQLTSGQSALASAKAQLEAGQGQLDAAAEEMQTQKDAAYQAANLDITIEMISAVLTAQDFSMPAGYITGAETQELVRVGDKLSNVADIENLMLFDTGIEGIGAVYLRDVALVRQESNEDSTYAKLNGQEGLVLSFLKQSNYSTAEVSENIAERFGELSKTYDGLQFTSLSDQGDYIYLVVNSVLENLLFGALFAVVILFFFLRDIRPTIVIALSIPISLMLAVILMYFSGITLNIISLSGLAVGVGMLVDNSVVVIENVDRIRQTGASAAKAALYGAKQVTGAILASSLTTICVFLPIVFIEGLTRQLFMDMALTIAYSLLASFFVAITLVPAMSATTLKNAKPKEHKGFTKFLDAYEKVLKEVIRHKWVALAGSLVLLVGAAYFSASKGMIFMPAMSGQQISVTVEMDDEAPSFQQSAAVMDELSARIQKIDDVATVGALISTSEDDGILSSLTGSSGMMAYVLLSDDAKRKDSEISKEIVEAASDLPCTITAQGAMDMSSYMSSMGGSGVSMNIFGDHMDSLITTADDVVAILSEVEGLEAVTGSFETAMPELRIQVDKNKAMAKGITTAQVFQSVSGALSKTKQAGTMTVDGISEDIVIHNPNRNELNRTFIEGYVVGYTDAKTGEQKEIPLKEIAVIRNAETLSSIDRLDQRRYVTVNATVADGYNVNLVTREAEKALADYKQAPGITIESAGENETIVEAMTQLGFMAILAIVIIYMIMVIQFQSLLSPFIVMFTIPLAFTGGFLALLLFGFELSVVSVIGFIMLAGIVVNNGIVLVDYTNQLRLAGWKKKDAIVRAAKTRMRPVLMTMLTTVLGLVMMAMGRGMGAELMQPLAIVCIGGLLYATIMTMFIVPIMYDLFGKKEMKLIVLDEDEDVDVLDVEDIAMIEVSMGQETDEEKEDPLSAEGPQDEADGFEDITSSSKERGNKDTTEDKEPEREGTQENDQSL